MSDNRNRSAGARGVCSVDAGGLVTAPIRGQRRRGIPSVVLPGDPDGCGWIAMGDGLYQACGVNVAPWRHLTRQHVRAQSVRRCTGGGTERCSPSTTLTASSPRWSPSP